MFYRENIRFLNTIVGRCVFFTLVLTVFSGNVHTQTTYTFNYTGSAQTLAIQPGNYEIACWGAHGGNGGGTVAILGSGGKGGYSKGIYSVASPTILYIYVGGQGQSNNNSNVPTSISAAGGWNGGGGGFTGAITSNQLFKGGGGGGSDVRTSQNTVYANRIIVAGGGGGGGGATFTNYTGFGGNGGGASGQDGVLAAMQVNHNGKGGTQIAGGAGGTMGTNFGVAGIIGVGGDGGSTNNNTFPAGGGGGGWFGGGGGAIQGGGGGGGSSYIGGVISGSTAMFGQSGFVPNPDTTGNGFVRIIQLCPVSINSIANPICFGKTTTLTTNALSNYSWSTGANVQSIFVSPTITTSYSVSATNTVLTALGTATCTGSSTLTITVNPLPSLNPSTLNSTICAGQTASLAVGGNPSTFTWQPGGQTGVFVTVSPTTTTIYTVTGTDANGCENSANVTQSVVAAAAVVLSPSSSTICSGSSVSIAGTGAATYTWQPGGFVGNTFTTNLSNPAIYTVTGTSSLGCIDSAIASVAILPVPALSFITASITCASLGSATVNSIGGIGPFSYTWAPIAHTSSVAVGLNPGTHSLTVFDAGTGCTTANTTVFNSLIPLTGNLNNTSSLTCPAATNGTAYFSNFAGGSGSENYIWTNGISSYTVANPQTLSAGQWSVNVTDALTGCPIFSVFAITEPTSFSLSLSSSNFSSCVGTSVVLTGTNSGGTPGYTYSWSAGPVGNTHTVSESSGGMYQYTLNSIDANNCVISNTIAVDFVPNPTLSVSSVSICPLEFGFLNVSGASSYTWSNNSNASSIVDNPLVSTQYSVIGSALGCTSIATPSIILKPTPFLNLSSNSPRCENTTLLITANTNATNFNWTGPNGFSTGIQNPTLTALSLSQSGIYNLTVTAANSCTAGASASVVVNPIPAVTAMGATVCTSQTLNLSSISVPGAGFLWSGPIGFASVQQNPSISNPGVNRSGVYFVRATSAQGCTNIATATVSVIPPPSLTVALSSNSLCFQAFNGSPNTITLTSNGASSYTLFTPDLTGNGNPAGPSTTVSTMPPYSSTLVLGTATIVGSNGVCTNSVTRNYSVIPNPTVVITPTPVICAGESYTYTSFGASSYVWTSSTPNFTTYNNGGLAVAHPSVNSVFSVFGTSLGCNSASQTSTINVIPLPVINIIPQEPIICLHEKITLTANGTGSSFEWFPAEGLNNTVGMSVIASPLQTKNYTVIASANNCTNTANITVTVLALPQPTIINSKTKLCVDETITLKGAGGESYDWFGPLNLFYRGQEIKFRAASVQFSGDYTLTATDKNGCKGNTVTPIVIQALPQGHLDGYKEQVCVPYCGDFNFSGVLLDSDLTSTWQIPIAIGSNQIISNNRFSHCFSEAGTYTIVGRIFDAKTTCSNTVSYQVKVHAKPQADFYFSPQKPVEGIDEVVFTNASIGEEQNNWNWFVNDEFKSKFESQNISYKFDNSGLYTIAMVVSNKWNCADTAIRTIQVETDFGMYIPNAFTPNNDGLNDEFKPVIPMAIGSASKYNLKIFDRWGHLIFESTEIEKGWDGTNRGGVNSRSGVYAWRIDISSLHRESKSLSGHVTLLR